MGGGGECFIFIANSFLIRCARVPLRFKKKPRGLTTFFPFWDKHFLGAVYKVGKAFLNSHFFFFKLCSFKRGYGNNNNLNGVKF